MAKGDTLENRPTCSVPGCTNEAAQTLAITNSRYPHWRRSNWIFKKYPTAQENFCCGYHHNQNTAKKHGVKSALHLTAKRQGKTLAQYTFDNNLALAHAAGFKSGADYKFSQNVALATAAGFGNDVNAYKNSKHRYRQHRKNYCQNADGRLGFDCPCNGEVNVPSMLDTDHIDGNHNNNDPVNLQTLCKCCHAIKSSQFNDRADWRNKTPEQFAKIKVLQELNRNELEFKDFSDYVNSQLQSLISI